MQQGGYGGYHVPPGYKLATVLVPQHEEPLAQDVVEYSSYQSACKRSIVADFTSELGVCLRRHDQPAQKPAEGARRGPRSASSKFRGVTRHRRTKRWESHIWHQRQQRYLGGFSTEAHAGKAHDIMALKCRGRHGNLNFPLETYACLLDYMESITQDEVVAALRHQNKSLLKPNKSGQDSPANSSPSQASNPSQETSTGEVVEMVGAETPSPKLNDSRVDPTTSKSWSSRTNTRSPQPFHITPLSSAQVPANVPTSAPAPTPRPSLVGKLQASLQQHSPRVPAMRVRSGFALHSSRPLPPWEPTAYDSGSPAALGAFKLPYQRQHSYPMAGTQGGKALVEPSVLTYRSLSDANSNVLLGRPVNVPALSTSPRTRKNDQLQFPPLSMAECRTSSYASSFTSMFDDLSGAGDLPLSFDMDGYHGSSSALADIPGPLPQLSLQPSAHSAEAYMRSSPMDASPVGGSPSPLASSVAMAPCRTVANEPRSLTPNTGGFSGSSSALAAIPVANVLTQPQRAAADADAFRRSPSVLAPAQGALSVQTPLDSSPLEHSPEEGGASAGSFDDSWDPTAVWNY